MSRRLAALALAALARAASADPPAAAVDVADLPPLPAGGEAPSSSATVLAAAQASEDIVVGAAKREQSLGNVASAVTVISGDRIRRFGYRTVGEALAAVAGVYLVDNRESYTIGIRGLNIPGDFNTRILVLVDGASINEAWGSFAGLGYDNFISIDDIARIELIRGPVSSVYGANAFFGIVNIVTRGASETPRAWARTSINSVNGSITSAGFATGGVHRGLRGTIQIMDRFGDTTSVPAVGNQLTGDGSHQFAGSLVGNWGGSFAQIRAVNYRREDPFAPFNADPTAGDPFQQYDKQILIEGGHTRELSDRFTIAGRAYANLYEYTDHIIQEGAVPFDDLGDAQTYGAELRGRYELVRPQRLGLTAGAEVNYNETNSHSYQEDNTIDTVVPKNFDIEGIYSEVDAQPTPWLGFTGGVRYDRNSVVDTHVSPRAALFLAKPESYGLKLLYAQGFRNPSAYEKFFYDNSSFIMPTTLNAETITSYEAILWAKPIPGLSTRVSAFSWDARDIVTAETVQNPMDPTSEIQQFQNAGRLVSEGIEAEGSYRDSSGWYGFAGGGYSHVGAADSTASTTVVYGGVLDAPAVTWAGGLSTPKLGGLAHVSTELVYIGPRAPRPDADGNPLPNAPAWLGWNATIYAPDVRGFDVTLGVRNILGTRDMVPTPPDYDRTNITPNVVVPFVPGEGREVYVKVGYRY
ncbi:MAG TPA: TonB-dependent receptor [Kofleriaceae bacterium]|nr:TonB-dependent receptor [Kofleriaceae bacterium]